MDLEAYLEASAQLIRETARHIGSARLESAISLAVAAIAKGRPILVCGNGGSASDAMHIVGELVGRFLKDRPALKAIALSANPAVLTAWANDCGYETTFARQVEAYGEPDAVLIGLSTSGNSPNVLEAFRVARTLNMHTIAFTGAGGGKLAALSDVLLDVPSASTPMIQQVHICLYHYFCEQVEARCAAR